MEKKKEKIKGPRKARSVAAARVFAILISSFIVSLFLSAEGIHTWSSRLKKESSRDFFLAVSSPLLKVSEKTGAAKVWKGIRTSFHAWVKDATFSRFGAAGLSIPLSSVNRARPSFTEIYFRIRRGEAAKPKPVYTPLRPLEMLVAGDSLAWLHVPTMVTKAFSENACVNVASVSKISSNFSDPSYFDWIPGIGKLYEEKIDKDGGRYDCLVMIIGANDAQSIYLDNVRLFYGTPEWEAEFEARVRRYMEITVGLFRKVYWVAIPPMRKEGYKDRMVTVNGIYEKICGEYPAIDYVPVKDLLGDEKGDYIDAKVIDGRQQVIRATDGIHYEFAGGQLVAGRIKSLLERDFDFLLP